MRFPRNPSIWLAFAAALIVAVVSGCASSGRSGRERPAPQPSLFAKAVFFDGSLLVEATLGPFGIETAAPVFNRQPPAPGEGEPVPVRDGSFGGRTGREVGTGFPRGPAEEGAFGEQGPGGARNRGGPSPAAAMPRQSMTVSFQSQSSEPIAVGVIEVKSALGNFVPVPEAFTLPARGVQSLEPMRSAYPGAIDELELLVSLRVRGREETQVLHLEPSRKAD